MRQTKEAACVSLLLQPGEDGYIILLDTDWLEDYSSPGDLVAAAEWRKAV